MQVLKDGESKTKTYTCMIPIQPGCRSAINSGHYVQPTHHKTPARAVPGWKYRLNKKLMKISRDQAGEVKGIPTRIKKIKGKVIKKGRKIEAELSLKDHLLEDTNLNSALNYLHYLG